VPWRTLHRKEDQGRIADHVQSNWKSTAKAYLENLQERLISNRDKNIHFKITDASQKTFKYINVHENKCTSF
jgi:hypothetical protein